MKNIGFVLLFISYGNLNFAQSNFIYKEIPTTLTSRYNFPIEEFDTLMVTSFKQAVNIGTYLPKNYSKNGDVDYTSFLQKGIDENNLIIMPNFPVLIDPKGLHLKSNSKILFQLNSILIIKSNREPKYHGILIDKVKNIDLYYPNIVGDRYSHQSESGQWGMGIWIMRSENINIHNPVITKCWGDGIYIGNKRNKPSCDINIYSAFLDDNRRNGISITCGKNILIEHPLISNTNGNNPKSGIDIEPNTNKDIIESIVINSPVTFNNAMHGIMVSTGNLAGELKKSISFAINNHVDYFSTVGLGLSVTRSKLEYKNIIEGFIRVQNYSYYNNSHAAIKTYKGKNHNVQLQLINVEDNEQLRLKKNSFIISFNQSAKSIIKNL